MEGPVGNRCCCSVRVLATACLASSQLLIQRLNSNSYLLLKDQASLCSKQPTWPASCQNRARQQYLLCDPLDCHPLLHRVLLYTLWQNWTDRSSSSSSGVSSEQRSGETPPLKQEQQQQPGAPTCSPVAPPRAPSEAEAAAGAEVARLQRVYRDLAVAFEQRGLDAAAVASTARWFDTGAPGQSGHSMREGGGEGVSKAQGLKLGPGLQL